MKTTAVSRPRTKPPEVRRDELMDAAEALFLEKGYAATSVSEIVEKADVAKGTFYLYFKTKDDALAALRARFVDGFCARVDAAMAVGHRDWGARIDAWVDACMGAYLDSVAVHDLVFHQHTPASREMKAGNRVVTRLADLLEQGRQAGAWKVSQPRTIAVMLFDALHGAVDNNLVAEQPITCSELTDVVKTFYRNALAVEPT